MAIALAMPVCRAVGRVASLLLSVTALLLPRDSPPLFLSCWIQCLASPVGLSCCTPLLCWGMSSSTFLRNGAWEVSFFFLDLAHADVFILISRLIVNLAKSGVLGQKTCPFSNFPAAAEGSEARSHSCSVFYGPGNTWKLFSALRTLFFMITRLNVGQCSSTVWRNWKLISGKTSWIK